MALVAKGQDDTPRELPKAGLQPGVCCGVFDIGNQIGFEGKVQHKCILCFELAETIKAGDFEGKRFVISEEFTVSLHEKSNLGKFLEGWRGESFTEEERKGWDVEQVYGWPVMLNVIHKKRTNKPTLAVINSAMPLPDGFTPMKPENPRDWCPKWIKDKQKAGGVGLTADDPSTIDGEEIPF